ncbi:MAG: hypothetical protein COB98_08825 [Flavobacteriaceae bacterium]|nr:MAG: hypothetical protein COB98_08825 [Flavobacteriaceae bacterium]
MSHCFWLLVPSAYGISPKGRVERCYLCFYCLLLVVVGGAKLSILVFLLMKVSFILIEVYIILKLKGVFMLFFD